MKTFYTLLILFVSAGIASAQQTYVSKKMIRLGKYENGQVNISKSTATSIFKTDFNFKPLAGSHCNLIYIGSDNDAISHDLIFKKMMFYKATAEKSYEFAVNDGSPYPQNYIQITISQDGNKEVCFTMQTDVAKFVFYCKKI